MDLWDCLRGLKRWWWILVLFPGLAGVTTWIVAPKPAYETTWTVNVLLDDPEYANNQNYFDFLLLDDLDSLMRSGALGDVMYLKLPEATQSKISREKFGDMIESRRQGRSVEITISGDDADTVQVVAETITANLEGVANQYLLPADNTRGPVTINILDDIPAPTLNTTKRLVTVGAITTGAMLLSLAATGVAEWLRMSYRAKNSAR